MQRMSFDNDTTNFISRGTLVLGRSSHTSVTNKQQTEIFVVRGGDDVNVLSNIEKMILSNDTMTSLYAIMDRSKDGASASATLGQ